jgi:hypothetical protein
MVLTECPVIRLRGFLRKAFILAFYMICSYDVLLSQAISITEDGSVPDASAMLDVKSTDKGMLVPRMYTGQRTMIASPATGLLVYDNDTDGFWFYNGTAWISLSVPKVISDADGDTKVQVEESGDEDNIRFDVAGTERMRIDNNGNLTLVGTLQSEAFITPTLVNNWVNYGGDYAGAGYYKDSEGVVHLRGLIKNGTASLIMVLPVGYKPSGRLIFTTNSNNNFQRIDVLSNGEVTLPISYGTAFLSLNGISFRAE